MISDEEMNLLRSLTTDDKIFLMEKFMKKIDVDDDDILDANEIESWIHFVQQTRVYQDVETHVCH